MNPYAATSAEGTSVRVPSLRVVFFMLIAVGGCAADLISKHVMFDRLGLPSGDTDWVIPGIFGFRTSLNEGALFGLGQGLGFFFAGLSVLAATFIVYWLFWVGAARDRLLTYALASVMAGIFGNLYDRLGMPGLTWPGDPGNPIYAVRDWIHCQAGRFQWPTFNIADVMLVCGAALLMYHAFMSGPQPVTTKADVAS